MKFSSQQFKLVLIFSNYLAAASLGHLQNVPGNRIEHLKREIDALISPQQDPNLSSSYGYAIAQETTKGSDRGFNAASEEEEPGTYLAEKFNGSAEDDFVPSEAIDYADYGVAGDEDDDDGIYQRGIQLEPSNDVGEITENSLRSSLKKLLPSKGKDTEDDGAGPTDDDCDDLTEMNNNQRSDTKESENGKTIPDYFDPEMGAGFQDEPCDDEEDEYDGYERTREGDDQYEDTHLVSKANIDIMSIDDPSMENNDDSVAPSDQASAATIFSTDPAEVIPFPKVRLYNSVSEMLINETISAQGTDTAECESGAASNNHPSSLAAVCCLMSLLLWTVYPLFL